MKEEQSFVFRRDRTKATKFTKNEILQDLKTFSEECRSRSFTTRQYDKWKRCRITSGSVTKIFGSWSKAMQEAGLKATRVWKRDIKDLVETFKRCWVEQKSEPTRQQFEDFLKRTNSLYTIKSYTHYFGSLGRLAKRIVEHQNAQISDAQLFEKYEPSKARKPLPLDLRYSILQRDNHRCVVCGASPSKDTSVTLEVDHISPVAKGGSDSPDNLRTLCHACNQGKKDKIE